MRDIYPLVDAADKIVTGVKADNEVLKPLMTQICDRHVASEHKRAVIALCEVAVEMYAGVLTLVAARLGVPAETLCRTLFETSSSAAYLSKDEGRYRDFLQHGVMQHYEIMRDVDVRAKANDVRIQNDLLLRERDYNIIKQSFGKASQWYKRSVKDIVEDAGFGGLYKTFYKSASSISHGGSFWIIRRRHFQEWDIVTQRELWDRQITTAARFSFLLVSTLFEQINATLALGYDNEAAALTSYIALHPEYAIP